MRKHTMPDMKEGGVNVTPLIDIVMCLIIFFMLVTKIGVNTGSDKSITIPTGFYGTNIADMQHTLTLNVVNGPNGVPGAEPIITALVGTQIQELRLATTPKLIDTLRYFREGDPSQGIKPDPDFKVIIRGDETLKFNFLSPILITCAKANVKSFAFATLPGQRPGENPSPGGH